ncbi:hypothetical protein AX15_001086 [Amanita polypyramis BW_CC]|nr:hypothetical protein AX15_001086 [Amanita polypyramis BW_CC]
MTQESHDSGFSYSLLKTLKIPSSVSSLAFGHAGHLFVGADDGVLRVYDLSTFKVVKAVKNLGSEIPSIVCVKRRGSDLRDAWIASGTKIMKFQLDHPKMIQDVQDALDIIEVCTAQDELVNEIGLNGDKSRIAFSTDTGVVGVVDPSTKAVTRMKTEHKNVCGCVKFIPTRPKELISGGYDQKLFHFDYSNGNLLSEREIVTYTLAGEISLSPPFIMSMAVSQTGVVAAGIADGRLWINFAGETSNYEGVGSTKTSGRWNGLDGRTEHVVKIAEGPVVAMAFGNTRTLTVSSLLGAVIQYRLTLENENQLTLEKLWQRDVSRSIKVNALLVDEKRIIAGGLQSDGSGIIEIWQKNVSSQEAS